MRIVDVCAFYSPRGGGVRTYIDQKLGIAGRMGHDITILAPMDEARTITISSSARVVGLAAPRFPLDRKYWFFNDAPAIHRALDMLEPDLVEVSSPWRSPLMVEGWRPEVPKALIMHADPLSAYAYRWFGQIFSRESIDRSFDGYWRHLRRLGRSFDAVVCASRDLASRLVRGGVGGIVTVPMGVQPGLFSPVLRNEAVRRTLLALCMLGPDAGLLLAVGRLAPEKRLPMLIEAVTNAGRDRPLGLAILGDGRDKPAVMRAIAGNPHVRLFHSEFDRTKFARILASADALVHGCEAETFCMAAAEAQASGTFMIVPDRGGAADFVAQGRGVTYRAGDRADLARVLKSAMRTQPDVGARAEPRSIVDHFSALFGLYENLLQSRSLKSA